LHRLRRRNFIAVLGGALGYSLGARAQEPAVPVIGFLSSGSANSFQRHLNAFREGLKESGGYVEGQNVAIDYRWAEGDHARLPELANALVRRRVSLIAATGGSTSAHAAKAATAKIPIPVLFIAGPDPVSSGLVQGINRPGGNATGVAMMSSQLIPKRVELLLQLIPKAKTVAVFLNPSGVGADDVEKEVEASIRMYKRQMVLAWVNADTNLDSAFASVVRQGADALLVSPNAFFTDRRNPIVTLAARYGLPGAYAWREYPEAGGLSSYGPSVVWAYHQIGEYAGRILQGAKPGDLPVQMPTKMEQIINLKVAKALGLTIPRITLAGTTEVIE
jgi:putative tryptophan/tyrosine transport system substrate-binding protein